LNGSFIRSLWPDWSAAVDAFGSIVPIRSRRATGRFPVAAECQPFSDTPFLWLLPGLSAMKPRKQLRPPLEGKPRNAKSRRAASIAFMLSIQDAASGAA
jgi:hypothetical protein